MRLKNVNRFLTEPQNISQHWFCFLWTCVQPQGFEIRHTHIDRASSKLLPLLCARAFQSLLWSPTFYPLSIVYSLLPHLVKSGSSFFLSEWRQHHLVSIHLLIAAGNGDHLVPAWYLAFIMLLRFKRGLSKTLSASSTPPDYLHDPPSAFTADQVNPPEKRPGCIHSYSAGTYFFIIMIVCQHHAPCPFSSWNWPI